MSFLIDSASWICLVVGGAFCIVGTIGLNRMPDFFTRMHASSVTDTAGAGFMLLGLMLQAGWTLVMVKLVFVALMIFFASPTATHALANAALARGLKPRLHEEEPTSKRS